MLLPDFESSDSLEDLRCRLTWRLGFVLIGFGILGAWYLLIRRDLPFESSGYVCLLIVLARCVQVILDRNPVLARHLLVWGVIAHVLVAMLLFSDPWLPYIALPCVFVSAMLINNGSIFTAGSIAGLVILLNLTGARDYPLGELTITLALAAISSWLGAYTMFTAVHWYRAMQERSEQLLRETRDHRAELSQTLKSLEIAYDTQTHIQADLIWARKQADDLRRLKEQFAANIS